MTRYTLDDLHEMHPADSYVEWAVMDTVGTIYGPIADEAMARELALSGRRLCRREVRRGEWTDESAAP